MDDNAMLAELRRVIRGGFGARTEREFVMGNGGRGFDLTAILPGLANTIILRPQNQLPFVFRLARGENLELDCAETLSFVYVNAREFVVEAFGESAKTTRDRGVIARLNATRDRDLKALDGSAFCVAAEALGMIESIRRSNPQYIVSVLATEAMHNKMCDIIRHTPSDKAKALAEFKHAIVRILPYQPGGAATKLVMADL